MALVVSAVALLCSCWGRPQAEKPPENGNLPPAGGNQVAVGRKKATFVCMTSVSQVVGTAADLMRSKYEMQGGRGGSPTCVIRHQAIGDVVTIGALSMLLNFDDNSVVLVGPPGDVDDAMDLLSALDR